MAGRWAVAITQPQCELKAVFHAQRRGFECYLPKIKTKQRVEPLFPRYVFVACNDAWRALLSTIGISGVITHADKPAILKDDAIIALKERCDENDIFIEPPPFAFRRGMRVRIKCGLLMGVEGTIHKMRGHERVEVLISMLGSNKRVDIFEGNLAAL